MLLGTWKTEAEQYEDRFIEIGKKIITFGTGEDIPNTYYIRGIDYNRLNDADEYTIMCVNAEDTEFRFIFYFENHENGLLMRLNNPRQVVWTKDTSSLLGNLY